VERTLGLVLGTLVLLGSCSYDDTREHNSPPVPDLSARPNVIVFVTDDQGYQDLGVYGSPLIRTPRIDQMAREGVLFTDFYAGASVCTPSRAALMTGCYPSRVGFSDPLEVLSPHDFWGLDPEETTLAELLKTRGYATALVGKWHLGHRRELLPTRQGFDHFLGIPYSNDMLPVPLYRDEEKIAALGTGEEQKELTRLYTDEGIRFIQDNRDKPFFLYIAYAMPHIPLHASDDFEGSSARGLYGDVIEEIDFHVGRVLDTLKVLDLDHDTLVIFTSDNGPWLSYGDLAGSADPFRGGKATNWEGGFRVPCVMWWPGSIPAGQVNGEVVALFDFYPTLAALAGAELPGGRISGFDIAIDGEDIWPLMSGEPGAVSPHEAFYYDLAAVRSGKWKLKDGMLFDLESDPGEQADLSGEYPDKAAELQQMLAGFSEDLLCAARPPGAFPPPLAVWEAASTLEPEGRHLSVTLNLILFLLLPLGALALHRRCAAKRR
jgi:arylsulfatase A